MKDETYWRKRREKCAEESSALHKQVEELAAREAVLTAGIAALRRCLFVWSYGPTNQLDFVRCSVCREAGMREESVEHKDMCPVPEALAKLPKP